MPDTDIIIARLNHRYRPGKVQMVWGWAKGTAICIAGIASWVIIIGYVQHMWS